MPDLDPESLARRAGVERAKWQAIDEDYADVDYYSAESVAAMLAQYRREVLEEAAQAIEAAEADAPSLHALHSINHADALRRLAEKG